MKFLSVLTLATGMTAAVLGDDEGNVVPGQVGVRYCEEKDYPIWFNTIDYDKYPAMQGENITVIATGHSKRYIPEGSTVELKLIRMNGIMHKTFKQKLCPMKGVECSNGENTDFEIEFETEIHDQQAIHNYDMQFRIKNHEKETLTCVKGKLEICGMRKKGVLDCEYDGVE